MNRIDNQRRETARECDDASVRGVDVPLYLMYRGYMQSLDEYLEKAHTRVKEGEVNILERKTHLQKETVKKKSLVSLKERQLEDYLARCGREEQNAVDELILMRRGVDR
jgi:flagellar export protein FliJ